MVFEYVERFGFPPGEMVFIGSRTPLALNLSRLRRRNSTEAVQAELKTTGILDPDVLAACRIAGREKHISALSV